MTTRSMYADQQEDDEGGDGRSSLPPFLPSSLPPFLPSSLPHLPRATDRAGSRDHSLQLPG